MDDTPDLVAMVGYNYAKKGWRDEAVRKLDELKTMSTSYVSPDFKAWIHVGLGETNQAILCLEEACEKRFGGVMGLKIDPLWQPVRSDPRFIAILKKVALEK